MSFDDLPTRQQLEALANKLETVHALLVAQAQAPAAEDMLSVLQVATYTGFDRKTVEKWVKEGQFDQTGHKVYLRAYEYSGRLRFKRGDVEAFGLGVGVLAQAQPGEAPTPTKKSKRKPKPVASETALRVA